MSYGAAFVCPFLQNGAQSILRRADGVTVALLRVGPGLMKWRADQPRRSKNIEVALLSLSRPLHISAELIQRAWLKESFSDAALRWNGSREKLALEPGQSEINHEALLF
jgi:hypothetical protein